jgi:hypothetical protein
MEAFAGSAGSVAAVDEIGGLYDEWSVGYHRRSNSWSTSVSATYHPHWARYSYDSSGVTKTATCLDVTVPANTGYDTYTPLNLLVLFPYDPNNNDTYYSVNFVDSSQVGWADFEYVVDGNKDECKMGGMMAGMDPVLDDDGNLVSYNNNYPTYGPASGFSYNKHQYMSKATTGSDYLKRVVSYPGGEWNPIHWTENLYDPGTTSTWYRDYRDQKVYNITIRGVLDDGTGYGFYEYFINGEFSRRIEYQRGTTDPIDMAADNRIKWDGLIYKYHWGGGSTDAPENGPATLRIGDGVWFRYKPTYQDAKINERSQAGRKLSLPASIAGKFNYQ